MAGSIIRQCEWCGSEIRLYPSDLYKKRFCSRRCRALNQASKLRKRIPVKCDSCGVLLERQPAKVMEHNFCNVKCMGQYYSKKGTKEFKCDYCGHVFLKNPYKVKRQNHKFCSDNCRNKWISENKRVRIKIECANCGEEIERFPYELKKGNNLFCNKDCRASYLTKTMNGENNHNWRGGHDDYRGDNWLTQRRKALERDGYKCSKCGKDGTIVKLMVHHKIPFRYFDDYKKANRLNNLITLCNSCHSYEESHYWETVPEELRHLL